LICAIISSIPLISGLLWYRSAKTLKSEVIGILIDLLFDLFYNIDFFVIKTQITFEK